jgi:hypothetical protein
MARLAQRSLRDRVSVRPSSETTRFRDRPAESVSAEICHLHIQPAAHLAVGVLGRQIAPVATTERSFDFRQST